jgi:solute carrier family 15 (peptide/histidine transporter), member 3/4
VLSNGEAGSLHGVPQKHLHDDSHNISSSGAKRSVLLSVTSFIVVCELCERLAYYSVAGSLVLFLQRNLNMSNAAADQQYSLWSGVCYITPLLGGWAADAHLGRYRAILIFSCIYLVGLLLTAYGAIPSDNSGASPAPLVLTGIYIIAVGTGGIKPCVSTFGADQFDDSNPQDQKEKASYFNWFYFAVNFGALISYTAVSYVCQYGIKGLGGEKWGFTVGFSIPCTAMTIAILIFLAGSVTNLHKFIKLKLLNSLLPILNATCALLVD